jgi:hypothetical protein
MTPAKARAYLTIVIYSFIVLVICCTVITIINYDLKNVYSTGPWLIEKDLEECVTLFACVALTDSGL